MNIIYFHTHDMGRYCEPYGYSVSTPNMLRLAEEGCTFRNAFCLAPTSSPSRAALLTGQYPHQCGMFGLSNQGWRLNDYNRHLAAYLKERGYVTALAGAQHEDDFPPVNLPYDHILNYDTEDFHPDRWVTTECAIEFMSQAHEKPFFLSIGYDMNHHHRWQATYERSKEYFGEPDFRYIRPMPQLPDTPEIRQETALFQRAVQYVDLQLGRVMQALRLLGLEENTLLFFTTDHGPGLPHNKMTLTDAGTGTALIFRGPRPIPRGHVVDAMVTQLDVYPTICEYIGADRPSWLEGKSLLSLLDGTARELHDKIYLQQTYHQKYAPLRAVRTQRFKYVKRYGDDQSRAFYSADGGVAFDFLVANGYDRQIFPPEQLFDLYHDTNEVHNLIGDPDYGDIAARLGEALALWQSEKADPILNGRIEPH